MENKYITNNEQIQLAKNTIKERLLSFVSDNQIQEYIINKLDHISVVFLDREEFIKMSGANPKSISIPGAFYYNGNVYLKNREELNKQDFHFLVHEILHSLSDNFKTNGKTGLAQYYYDKNNKLESIGHVINEGATEYLTALILKDAFFGYANDLNYMIQIIMCIMNMNNEELISSYLKSDMWLDEGNNKRFNSENVGILTDIVSEYDNRLPKYQKKEYDFDFLFSNILDAINTKIKNSEKIDFIKLRDLLTTFYGYHDWIDIQENTTQKYSYTINMLNQIVGNIESSKEGLMEYREINIIPAGIKK